MRAATNGKNISGDVVIDKGCVSQETREPQPPAAEARNKVTRRSQAAARENKQPQKIDGGDDVGQRDVGKVIIRNK